MKYEVPFSGFAMVEAESREEAIEKAADGLEYDSVVFWPAPEDVKEFCFNSRPP